MIHRFTPANNADYHDHGFSWQGINPKNQVKEADLMSKR